MAISAIHSPYQVARTSLEGLALPPPFGAWLGEIGPATSIFIWGDAGAGKTTLAMDLLGMIASVAGPVLFVSVEEGIGLTLQMKIERLQLGAIDHYDITDSWEPDALKTHVLERGYRGVLLDTVSAADPWAARPTLAFLKWAKAHDVVFIFIAHARKDLRTYLGTPALAERADVIIRCNIEKHNFGGKIAEVLKNPYAATPKRIDIRMKVHRR